LRSCLSSLRSRDRSLGRGWSLKRGLAVSDDPKSDDVSKGYSRRPPNAEPGQLNDATDVSRASPSQPPRAERGLPDDATIEELAQVFGVWSRGLTPAARRLTKGDLVRLWGAEDAAGALSAYQAQGALKLRDVEVRSRQVQLLSVEDIHSIQAVFGSPVVPADRLLAVERLQVGGEAGLAPGWTVYACCCPCCCATSVLEPLRQLVD